MMTKLKTRGVKLALSLSLTLMMLLSISPGNPLMPVSQKVEAYGEEDGYFYAETWLYDYDYDSSTQGATYYWNYDHDTQQAYSNPGAGINYGYSQCHNLRKGDRWMTGHQVPYENLNRQISAAYSNQNSPALYFGNFYGTANDLASTGDTSAPTQYTSKPNDSGNYYYSQVYNKYWQSANNAPKDNNAAIQGLVDRTLKNGTLTQGGSFELPQFSDNFVNNSALMHKYTTGKGFPFNIRAGTNGIKTYEFDSAYDNKRYYSNGQILVGTETSDPKGTVNWRSDNTSVTGGTYGFFPFNQNNITNMVIGRTDVNYGFGMKVNIPFNLTSTGTMIDNTGKEIDTKFEFSGDDDVWVFVDGVLVLDLGGDHAKVSGSINFNRSKQADNNTVYVSNAVTFNSSLNNRQRTNGTGAKNSSLPEMFALAKAQNASVPTFDANSFYDPTVEHTLTVFYMERGMFESNLKISFNFAPINTHKLTVREQTKFDVNPGLLRQTVAVADKDIFDYSIENMGTPANDVGISGIMTPTYTYIDRKNTDSGNYLLNRLSGQPEEYNPAQTIVDTEYIYLNPVFNNGNWTTANAKIFAWAWSPTVSGHYVEFKYDSASGLYRIPRGDYTGMKLRRFNPSSYPAEYSTNYNTGAAWNETGDITINNSQNKYNITNWDNSGYWSSSSDNVKITIPQSLKQVSNCFTPTSTTSYNKVANTTYRLTDPKGVLDSDKTTAKTTLSRDTTSDGHFRLMYGEDAFFNSQFKKGSTMRVKQSSTLAKPKSNRATNMGSDNGSRSVYTYYSTTVTVTDIGNRTVLSKTKDQFSGYNSYDGTYTFDNNAATTNNTVHLTELYVNTVKVGPIKVQKLLDSAESTSKTFKFKLTLTNIFGDTTSDGTITDYSGITISGANQTKLNADGTFEMESGRTATINGIPVQTQYHVEEILPSDSDFEINTASANRYMADGTVFEPTTTTPAPVLTEVNKRKVGTLEITKSITGTNADKNKTFPVTITFTPAEGVNLENYITSVDTIVDVSTKITDLSITPTLVSFSVTDGSRLKLKNIPYGTTYVVSESGNTGYTSTITYSDDAGKVINIAGPNDTVAIVNRIQPSSIIIKKYDDSTPKVALRGAEFGIYNTRADALAKTNAVADATYTKNAAGTEFTFGNLDANKDYYVMETTTPEGFKPMTEPLLVHTNTPDVAVPVYEVTNSRVQIQMPETGGHPFVINFAATGILMMCLAGAGMLVYKRKLSKAVVNNNDKGR